MRFVPVCCPLCGLPFTVILSGGQRTAKVEREAWGQACIRAQAVEEPRLCGDFRATVFAVLGEDERPTLPGEEPRPARRRRPGPGRGRRTGKAG